MQAPDGDGMRGSLEEKLGNLARLVAVFDGLHETPGLERGHGGVAVELDGALVRLEASLVDGEGLGVLSGFKRGVSLLAFAIRRLALLHATRVALVDVRLHSLERGVVRHVLHPRIVLVVGRGPEVPRGVVRRARSSLELFLGEAGAIRRVQLARLLTTLLLPNHVVNLLLHLQLLLVGQVLVLLPLSLILRRLGRLRGSGLLRVPLLDLLVDVLGRDLAAVKPLDEAADVVHLVQEGLRLGEIRRHDALAEAGYLPGHRHHATRSPVWKEKSVGGAVLTEILFPVCPRVSGRNRRSIDGSIPISGTPSAGRGVHVFQSPWRKILAPLAPHKFARAARRSRAKDPNFRSRPSIRRALERARENLRRRTSLARAVLPQFRTSDSVARLPT